MEKPMSTGGSYTKSGELIHRTQPQKIRTHADKVEANKPTTSKQKDSKSKKAEVKQDEV